ncbi:MAG TPA: ABC transporter permease [Thermoflexales bacterium]|jgi:putative ABC transport system permease protein|nr:ABC transporter permease [Anaerolineae bacterium]HQV27764.1 ABC transporter permease [Thermoflexales bacterium]HQX10744.1 ABC transporter permease [Thermoflexales bacterium]HQY25728.1 ABC transporter permease [Thermoflexales bacterium]HQZ53143.1 ABC transporter permease [Thermoflexales bacterium]
MFLIEVIRLAFRTLRSNPLRAVLTLLGISIGVGAVIALISIGSGVQRYVTDQFTSAGTNVITVTPGRMQRGFGGGAFAQPAQLTMSDWRAVANEVQGTSAMGVSFSRASSIIYTGKSSNVNINGVSPQVGAIQGWTIASGRFIDDADIASRSRVLVIGQSVAKDLFESGEDPIDQSVRVNGLPFRIVGTLVAKGASFIGDQDAIAFVPITTAQERLFGSQSQGTSGERTISTILLQANDDASRPAVQRDTTQILADKRKIEPGEPNDFTVLSQAELVNSFGLVLAALTTFLGAIAAISLLVGGVGIMNIMLVSVTERTREIGLRKAIGAKSGAILSQFLIEAIVLATLGGIVGVLIGVAGAALASRLAGIPADVQPASVILAVGFSTLVGLFFGLWPARRASRLSPIEALRFE